MTTDANHFSVARSEEGQSVFEFLLMLPVMFGLVVILVKVNTAIQESIVDQQYARAEATFLTFNSPVFPESALRSTDLDRKNYNQMMIGVMKDPLANGAVIANPSATTQSIARGSRAPAGSDETQAEPSSRSVIRVRNTVSLCSQSEVIGTSGGQIVSILDPMSPTGTYNLPDTPIDWEYCRSGVQMMVGSANP